MPGKVELLSENEVEDQDYTFTSKGKPFEKEAPDATMRNQRVSYNPFHDSTST